MTAKPMHHDGWQYIIDEGPNKETIFVRCMNKEPVSLSIERSRPRPGGKRGFEMQRRQFLFLLLSVGHDFDSRPEEIISDIVTASVVDALQTSNDKCRITGILKIIPKSAEPSIWLYCEFFFNPLSRVGYFLDEEQFRL